MAPILSVKAGRAHRRSEDSNWVDPLPAKGRIELEVVDDLLSLSWKSRESSSTASNDEYILFPGDCTFEKVDSDPTGRSYVLKFSSSDQRVFYWFQDANLERHDVDCFNINSVIENPEFQPIPFVAEEPVPQPAIASAAATSIAASGVAPPETPAVHAPSNQPPAAPQAQRTADLLAQRAGAGEDEDTHMGVEATPSHPRVRAAAAAGPSGLGAAPAGGIGGGAQTGAQGTAPVFSQEQVDAFARLLGGAGAGRGGAADEPARLTDILTPSALHPLLASDPSLIPLLVPHLPPTLALSSPPTSAEVSAIVASPQFHEAVAGFDAALRTGGLRGLMPGLGLPESAGAGVGPFLDAVIDKAKREGAGGGDDDRMDTD